MSTMNPKYSLSDRERERFNRLWREEIQFFPEVPWRIPKHCENAKRFAARVYGLALEEQKQLNKPNI
jgi:hypothetical protein